MPGAYKSRWCLSRGGKMPDLIGLYSPCPQCGKTTLAGLLLKEGYRLLSFADPLRATLDGLLGWMDGSEIRDWPKEEPIPVLGASPRRLLQTLGTEWGRKCVKESVWVDLMAHRLEQMKGQKIVIDDMRFPNELFAIKARGGLLVRIDRPGFERVGNHASDGALDSYEFDLYITNDKEPEWMMTQLRGWRG